MPGDTQAAGDAAMPSTGRRWLATMAVGQIPGSPGTYGSALTGVLLFGLWLLLRSRPSLNLIWNGCLVAGLILFSILCVRLGKWAVIDFGRKDPGPFVLDEAAGMCLTLLLLPLVPPASEWWVVLAAFGAFRLFDITKPPPCRWLEKLPGGWGILMDDLAAAVYANVVCQVVFRVIIY